METDKYKILVIDDEYTIRDILSRALPIFAEKDNLEYEVLTAENGADALKRLEEIKPETPDVIVSDITMPIMNGLEFLTQLNDKGYRSIPVILCSGNSDDMKNLSDNHRAIVKEILQKPIRSLYVYNAVKKYTIPR
ncbi:response regulator [Candidatus Woesearchaeota archaeon]|nr:response regulator [Candidatus Woesearchaeota archaeon]